MELIFFIVPSLIVSGFLFYKWKSSTKTITYKPSISEW